MPWVGAWSTLPGNAVLLAGHHAAMELADIEMRGQQWCERCSSTIENASGYVVTLITVVPSRALALVSTYVADLSGPPAVTHMQLVPGRPARCEQQLLEDASAMSRPRGYLLDHAAELRSMAEDALDEPVMVDVREASLKQADRVWEQHATAQATGVRRARGVV